MSRLTIFIWYCTPPDFEFLKCEIMLSYKCNHLIFLCGVSEHFTQLKIPDQCLHLRERLSMQFYKYNLFQLAPCFYKYLTVTITTGNKVQTVWHTLAWQSMLHCQCEDLKSSTFILEWRLKWIHLWSALDVKFDTSCFAENYWGRPGNPSELRWGMRRAVMKTAISVRHKRPLQSGSGQLSSQNQKSTNTSLARWRDRQSQI